MQVWIDVVERLLADGYIDPSLHSEFQLSCGRNLRGCHFGELRCLSLIQCSDDVNDVSVCRS